MRRASRRHNNWNRFTEEEIGILRFSLAPVLSAPIIITDWNKAFSRVKPKRGTKCTNKSTIISLNRPNDQKFRPIRFLLKSWNNGIQNAMEPKALSRWPKIGYIDKIMFIFKYKIHYSRYRYIKDENEYVFIHSFFSFGTFWLPAVVPNFLQV